MANRREVRGWALVGLAGSLLYVGFIVRMLALFAVPTWPLSGDVLVLLAYLLAAAGIVIAAAGLREALWYRLVQAGGRASYAASLLLLGAGAARLFQIPAEADPNQILFLFSSGILEWMAIPLVSYRSRGALAAVGLGVLGFATGFGFFPGPFPSVVDPLTWVPLTGRILEFAAVGVIGRLLFLLPRVSPASHQAAPAE